jgi:hypothetical protein
VEDLLVTGGHDEGDVRVFRAAAAAPVLTTYPRYNRDNFTVWTTTMEWALKSNELREAVDPGGDEYKKGKSKYRKDRQALMAICSVMPMDVM